MENDLVRSDDQNLMKRVIVIDNEKDRGIFLSGRKERNGDCDPDEMHFLNIVIHARQANIKSENDLP